MLAYGRSAMTVKTTSLPKLSYGLNPCESHFFSHSQGWIPLALKTTYLPVLRNCIHHKRTERIERSSRTQCIRYQVRRAVYQPNWCEELSLLVMNGKELVQEEKLTPTRLVNRVRISSRCQFKGLLKLKPVPSQSTVSSNNPGKQASSFSKECDKLCFLP